MAERTEPIPVSIADIKTWLNQGVTRCVGDAGYREDLGSVQERYGLNKAEVKALFQDTRLKGLRVNRASRIVIVEDMEETTTVDPTTTDAHAEGEVEAREEVQSEHTGGTASGAIASHPLEGESVEDRDELSQAF